MIRINSSYPIEEILQFCEEAQNDGRDGASNMDYVNWENKPHTLLYLLYKEKRFDGTASGYVIFKDEDRIVCGQGFYQSEIDRMVCCGVRSYTVPGINCSAMHGDIKDLAFDIARDAGMAGCFFSFNEYNKRYVDGYLRVNDPVNFTTSFCDENGQWWSRRGRKIHPHVAYGPIRLKGTKQWIIYHLFEQKFEQELLLNLKKFDW